VKEGLVNLTEGMGARARCYPLLYAPQGCAWSRYLDVAVSGSTMVSHQTQRSILWQLEAWFSAFLCRETA